MDAKMKARLAKFNKNFATQKQRAEELGGFSEIPDGKYLTQLTECALKESKAGELHFVFTFKIQESAEDESLVGQTKQMWCSIEKEDGLAYLIRDLRKFGIEVESAEDLGKVADLLDGQKPEVKITLKSKDSGQFCYLDKLIGEVDAGDMASNGEDDGEDDDEDGEDSSEDEESEEETDTEEETSIEIGMEVSFPWKGETLVGKVKVLDEKQGIVKVSSGGKLYPVAADKIELAGAGEEEAEEEEEEAEEEEKPVKKAAPKKVAPKAKAKPAAKKRK